MFLWSIFFTSDDDSIISPGIKSFIQKIELLSADEIEILNNLTEAQLKNIIALCKSIKD